ncbi:MAG: esterase [Alcaligenaceae bacterium]|nr:esterase [Alcaligenaceae bacterium]
MPDIDFSDTLALIPKEDKPNLLFVLLHGESAGPEQLYPLVEALKKAFPLALLILPPVGDESRLDELAAFVRKVQGHYGVSGEQTALAGFSQGARMALETSRRHADLAGRVLAFSGLYQEMPGALPETTMIHFFHGAADQLLPLSEVETLLQRLGEIQADVTVDVASQVGHELHPALIEQAIVRLQTCVPLRSWKEAYGELGAGSRGENDASSEPSSEPPTLH